MAPGFQRCGARGARRDQRFELLADLGDVRQVGDVDSGGERAPAGIGDDQPVALEAFERFPDGGAAESELARQALVVDRFTGPDVEHDEPLADQLVGAIGVGDRRNVVVLRPFHAHRDLPSVAGHVHLTVRIPHHTLLHD